MELELFKKKKIYYISGVFGLHASIVLIRYDPFSFCFSSWGWLSLIINTRIENAHVPYSK